MGTIHVSNQHSRFSRQAVFGQCFVFGVLIILFLLTSCTSHTQYLLFSVFLDFSRDRVDVFLRSTSLKCRPSSLEVASVVLGPYESEDDGVCGHRSNEDALDKGVIWHIFWAIRPLDRRAEVFAAGYGIREMGKNDPVVGGEIPTGFDLSRSCGDHGTQLESHTRECGPERRRRDFRQKNWKDTQCSTNQRSVTIRTFLEG